MRKESPRYKTELLQVGMNLTPELIEGLKEEAWRRTLPVSGLLREIIREYLERVNTNAKPRPD